MEVNFIKVEGQKSVNPHNQEHSRILQKQMSYLDTPRNRAWYKVLLAASLFRNGVPGSSDTGWGREKGGKTSTRIFYQVAPFTMPDKGVHTSSHWDLVGRLIEFTSELCASETTEKQTFGHWLLLCTDQE